MYRLLYVILFLIVVSCTPQRKLTRAYVGQPLSAMEAEFGKATTVFKNAENSVYIFEKTENLKSTEISQGKLTLDPMVTPKVTKTEKYYVTVVDDKIKSVKIENEYERK